MKLVKLGVRQEVLCLPKQDINPFAKAVHGYSYQKLVDNGARSRRMALKVFCTSLKKIKAPVVLVAHNGRSFDTAVFRFELAQERMSLPDNVVGFLDSLHWAKHVLKRKTRCSLTHLCADFDIADRRNVHGALEDSVLLRSVCKRLAKPKSRQVQVAQETKKDRQPPSDCYETIGQWKDRTAIYVSAKAYVNHSARLEKARAKRRREREERRRTKKKAPEKIVKGRRKRKSAL